MIKQLLTTAIASMSLFTVSTAQASPAQALSLSQSPSISRAVTDAGDSNELTGNALGFVIGAVVLGAMVWGIIELADDDSPDSN